MSTDKYVVSYEDIKGDLHKLDSCDNYEDAVALKQTAEKYLSNGKIVIVEERNEYDN